MMMMMMIKYDKYWQQ